MVDLLFGTDNAYDIPRLDPSLQALALEPPLVGWGTIARRNAMRGTWHFYVSDYRFASLWDRPDQVLETGCLAAIEPNCSVFDQTPYAMAIALTYRKRWLARYWQSHGLRIFVDLNVSASFAELNLLGVPTGWRAFATRGYEERIPDLARELDLARRHAEGDPVALVYGGGPKVRETVEAFGGIHITDDQSLARDRHRAALRRARRSRR